MEGVGIIWLLMFIVGICITISPLIVWRNTNRTNRLLALLLVRQGVPKSDILSAYNVGGASLSSVPGIGSKFEDAVKQAVTNFREAAAPEQKASPEPAEPRGRFCHLCATDAPLDATVCPGCKTPLPENPVHCPRCGHEVTHQPARCPGCNTGLRWKEPTL